MKRSIPLRGRLFLGALEGLAIGAALGGWQFFTKTPLNMRTALTIAALYGFLNLVGVFRKAYEEGLAESVPAEEAKQRVFVEDPEVVLELAKLTGYEAIRRFTPYLGKWMTISGTYEGIAESLGRDSIHLTLVLNDGRRMNLRFAMTHEERLRELKEGQRITAICQIQHRDFSLIPESCEVIRAEPLRRAERSNLAYV